MTIFKHHTIMWSPCATFLADFPSQCRSWQERLQVFQSLCACTHWWLNTSPPCMPLDPCNISYVSFLLVHLSCTFHDLVHAPQCVLHTLTNPLTSSLICTIPLTTCMVETSVSSLLYWKVLLYCFLKKLIIFWHDFHVVWNADILIQIIDISMFVSLFWRRFCCTSQSWYDCQTSCSL